MGSYNTAIPCCCIGEEEHSCCCSYTVQHTCSNMERGPLCPTEIAENDENISVTRVQCRPVSSEEECSCEDNGVCMSSNTSGGFGGGGPPVYQNETLVSCSAVFKEGVRCQNGGWFGGCAGFPPDQLPEHCGPGPCEGLNQKICKKFTCGYCGPIPDGCSAIDVNEDCPPPPNCEPDPCCIPPPPTYCCCLEMDEVGGTNCFLSAFCYPKPEGQEECPKFMGGGTGFACGEVSDCTSCPIEGPCCAQLVATGCCCSCAVDCSGRCEPKGCQGVCHANNICCTGLPPGTPPRCCCVCRCPPSTPGSCSPCGLCGVCRGLVFAGLCGPANCGTQPLTGGENANPPQAVQGDEAAGKYGIAANSANSNIMSGMILDPVTKTYKQNKLFLFGYNYDKL